MVSIINHHCFLVGANEAWHDELKALTEALGVAQSNQLPPVSQKPETGRPKTQYSETTGRLLPPPSRGMSRSGGSRMGSRMGQRDAAFSAAMASMGAQEPDTEDMVS